MKWTCGALIVIALLLVGAGCSAPKAAAEKSEPAAKLSGPPTKESDLATLTLTPAAEERLGIQVAAVKSGAAASVREFAGDLLLPVGRSFTVTAPVSGTLRGTPPAIGDHLSQGQTVFSITPLLPLPRDLRLTAAAEVEQAKTRVETARLRLARAEKMLKDDVGTVRAQEDARNELDLATTALNAAIARFDQIQRSPVDADVSLAVTAPRRGMLRQILGAPGQVVTGGAPLFEVADLSSLWIRVPVYAGDAPLLRVQASIDVAALSGQRIGAGRPVPAPPTADPLAATIDFYFEISNQGGALKPGEKVLVRLPEKQSGSFIQVPWAAILFDTHGGVWLYEKLDGHRYARRRVDLDHTSNGVAYLRRGPANGVSVVTDGAAELWGTEFGAGK